MATTLQLSPVAGFCIKSTAARPAVVAAHVVPQGLKVFVNIAWDNNVPPPPPGNQELIRRAMQGQDLDQPNTDAWYVPVVVSNGRQDNDKAGNPSLVFDCIYNTSVRSRTLTDPEFKLFIVELALQRIEAQTSLVLSRQIGTPNIASKGKLLPRTVNIPSTLLTEGSSYGTPNTAQPLIKDVSSPRKKGILKLPPSPAKARSTWSWSKDGAKIQIKISVPDIPRVLIEHATLDIEPRRFILHIPDYPVLDVNFGLSDAEIVAAAASRTSASLHEESETEPNNALTLKRQRPLDVHGATSEWRVANNMLIILA